MSDFSKDPIRKSFRFGNIEAAKEDPILYSTRSQKLNFDWMELAGEHAPTAQILLQNDMLGGHNTSRFHGVDRNKSTINNLEIKYKNDNRIVLHNEKNIETLLLSGNNSIDRVVILVQDSENDWSKEISRLMPIYKGFAEEQAKKHGRFLLIINGVCRYQNVEKSKEIAENLLDIHMSKDDKQNKWGYYKGKNRRYTMLWVRKIF